MCCRRWGFEPMGLITFRKPILNWPPSPTRPLLLAFFLLVQGHKRRRRNKLTHFFTFVSPTGKKMPKSLLSITTMLCLTVMLLLLVGTGTALILVSPMKSLPFEKPGRYLPIAGSLEFCTSFDDVCLQKVCKATRTYKTDLIGLSWISGENGQNTTICNNNHKHDGSVIANTKNDGTGLVFPLEWHSQPTVRLAKYWTISQPILPCYGAADCSALLCKMWTVISPTNKAIVPGNLC